MPTGRYGKKGVKQPKAGGRSRRKSGVPEDSGVQIKRVKSGNLSGKGSVGDYNRKNAVKRSGKRNNAASRKKAY